MIRYFSCSEYNECLSMCWKERWQVWTCEGCKLLPDKESLPEEEDIYKVITIRNPLKEKE